MARTHPMWSTGGQEQDSIHIFPMGMSRTSQRYGNNRISDRYFSQTQDLVQLENKYYAVPFSYYPWGLYYVQKFSDENGAWQKPGINFCPQCRSLRKWTAIFRHSIKIVIGQWRPGLTIWFMNKRSKVSPWAFKGLYFFYRCKSSFGILSIVRSYKKRNALYQKPKKKAIGEIFFLIFIAKNCICSNGQLCNGIFSRFHTRGY